MNGYELRWHEFRPGAWGAESFSDHYATWFVGPKASGVPGLELVCFDRNGTPVNRKNVRTAPVVADAKAMCQDIETFLAMARRRAAMLIAIKQARGVGCGPLVGFEKMKGIFELAGEEEEFEWLARRCRPKIEWLAEYESMYWIWKRIEINTKIMDACSLESFF